MTKVELVNAVAEKTGLSKKDSEKAVAAVFDTITEALVAGDSVSLVGFGKFEVKNRSEKMGINPVLARDGNEAWLFHKGSSEIRLFVYDRTYLFAVSPINLLPKKEVEKVLDYMLDTDFYPYKLGIEGRQIYLCYRVHLADISEESEARIQQNLVRLAEKADEMDNMMVEQFGCEFSAYSKQDNEA